MNLKRILIMSGLLMSIVSCADNVSGGNECLVIAHRGASGYELENTIPAFQKAAELKVNAVELDVFRCSSGEIVVFHDDDLSRLSNENGKIEEFTYEQLRSIKLNGGYQIPLLGEVLDIFLDNDILVNIELKGLNTAKGVHELILSKGIDDKDLVRKIIISSFEWEELDVMRGLSQNIPIAVLTAEDPLKAIDFAKKVKAIAINPNAAEVSFSNVKAIHEAGLKVYAWTVNDEGLFKSLVYSGVDGVFCDYPDKAIKWVSEILSVPAH